MSSQKKIVLKCSDGETVEVDEAFALECPTIKHLIKDDCDNTSIPLPNVTSKILLKVVEFCNHHVKPPSNRVSDYEMRKFDANFVKVDQDTLFDLVLAADYLKIKSLLDLTGRTVADRIRGKTVEEMRVIFSIKSDYTPEEEEEVRRENAWAFR